MKALTLKYRLVFMISYLNLLAERLWNRFWPAATLMLFFLALALFNLPVSFGPGWHVAILGLGAAGFVATVLRTSRPFSFPSGEEVERQMEKVSILLHRPLETLQDKPVDGISEDALGLWAKHLKKTALYIHQLRIYTPQPDVSSRDRWALRHLAVIFVAIGLVIAQENAGARIIQALSPDVGGLVGKKSAALDLWIVPPEYTQAPPVFLATAKQGITARDGVEVPAGSLLKLRLAGYKHAPRLDYAGEDHALTEAAPGNFTFEMPLQQSGDLKLSRWLQPLGHWPVNVTPDTAPELSIVQIEKTPRSAVKITYTAADDYGLTKLTGTISGEHPGGTSASFDFPPVHASGEINHVEDLTAHPWAGLPVTLTLEAEDHAGHKSTSAPANFILPERVFTNPIAQRLIAERKSLLRSGNVLIRRAVAGNIAAIASQPGLYKGDIVTFMALSISVKRLVYDDSGAATDTVQDMLWNVALKLEDGGLSLAQQELRDSLQKLSEALRDKDTTQQQLQEMLDEVQKKMQQYVQALAQEMQQRLQQGKKIPVLSPELAQKFMKNIDLGKMLEHMRQMSDSNSREALQKMAESLKNAIENIDMKKMDEMQERQMRAMQALQDMEEIIHRQQKLFDETNKAEDAAEAAEQKTEQSGIRQKLGDALRRLAETPDSLPENFAKADQGMKLSGDAFGAGAPKDSLPHQKTALDELQKGLDEAIKKMAESMQQSIMSFGMMPGGGNFGEGYDPLGRESGRHMDDETIKIPSEKEQRRVQEIIRELRSRSNEPNRTKVERDYIDRLLDRF